MSYGIGRRFGSDLALLWFRHRPAATALIRPVAWEPPYAAGAALEKVKKTKKKLATNTYLSIITLNVNGLNAPIKRHRWAYWIKKEKPTIYCLQETHLRAKDNID